MKVDAREKVFVIVQAASHFLVVMLKALQWIFSLNLGACDCANFLDFAR